MLRSVALAMALLCILSTQAQINQLNPQGPAFYFTDAHLFNDQSLYLATGQPFIVKVPDLTDSASWGKNYGVIFTDSFDVNNFEVLTKSIFAVGPHFTRDGGQTFGHLHAPDDEEIYFNDGQDWAVIDDQRRLFYSDDAGSSWTKAPGNNWHFWNRSQNSLMFYRHTDTTAWQFANDSLYFIMRMRKEYAGFSTYTWMHQLDTSRFAFEQQQRVFIYDTFHHVLSMDTNHFFRANYTQVYIEGKRIVREEPAGKIQTAIAPQLNWTGKSPGYNGPSFGHSNGVSFYNSYLPFVPFGEGCLAYFRLNGNHRQLLGSNKHPGTGKIYATNDSDRFYAPTTNLHMTHAGRFFNSQGLAVGIDSSGRQFQHVTFDTGRSGLGYYYHQAAKSNDNAKTWTHYRSSADYATGSGTYDFRNLQYSVEGNCIWASVRESRFGHYDYVGREKSNGTLESAVINTAYFGSIFNHAQLLALNCDTAMIIIYGKAYYTDAGPDHFTSLNWSDTLDVYSLVHDGEKAVANTSAGFYTSPDLLNWIRVSSAVMKAPIMAVLDQGQYFGLHHYHLHYSRDSGQTTNKILLPWSPVESIAVANKTDLLLGGQNGQLYLLKNAATANITIGNEEVIPDDKAPEVVYFPNPAQSYFTLQWKEASAGRLQIFNLSGKEVRQLSFQKTNTLDLDISELERGIYIVKLEVDGRWEQIKLLVE